MGLCMAQTEPKRYKREDRFMAAVNSVGDLIDKGVGDLASLVEEGVNDFLDYLIKAQIWQVKF